MGLSDWRAKHNMRDPVHGVFRVTGFYDKHPSSSPPGTRITGVIVAPGIPATPAEHKVDERGRWADHQELPVLVDRSDPSRFAILWSEVQPAPWRDREMMSAQAEAGRINAAQQGFPPYPGSQGYPPYGGQPGMAPGAQVLGAPGRPVPGMPGGGLTPEQAAQMLAGGGGERASAIVIDAREIAVPPGMPSAPAGMVDISLEVRRADGTRYTTVTRVGFSTPERRARVATPGTQLTVLIDPGDRSRVAIDTSGLY